MSAVVNKATVSKMFWPVLAWTVAIVFFFPIFWMVLTSFKTDADAVKPEHLFVFTPTLENYLNMTENYDYWRFAKITAKIPVALAAPMLFEANSPIK